jgi:hypothetical protein
MTRYEYDMFGQPYNLPADVEGMTQPVRCASCSSVYDLGAVEVTTRYTDCSVWKAPCCGRVADDRGETGWKTTQDYYRIDRDGQTQRRWGQH